MDASHTVGLVRADLAPSGVPRDESLSAPPDLALHAAQRHTFGASTALAGVTRLVIRGFYLRRKGALEAMTASRFRESPHGGMP